MHHIILDESMQPYSCSQPLPFVVLWFVFGMKWRSRKKKWGNNGNTYCMTWMWSRCGEESRVTNKFVCTKSWILTEFDSSGCGNVLFWKYLWRVRFNYVFNMLLMTGQTGIPTWTWLSVQNWISRSSHEFRMWDVYWKNNITIEKPLMWRM